MEKYINLIGEDCYSIIQEYVKDLEKLDRMFKSIDDTRNRKKFNSWVDITLGQILDKYQNDKYIQITMPINKYRVQFDYRINPKDIINLRRLCSGMKRSINCDNEVNIDCFLNTIDNMKVTSIYMSKRHSKSMTCHLEHCEYKEFIDFLNKNIFDIVDKFANSKYSSSMWA